jgi:hypothetical protein
VKKGCIISTIVFLGLLIAFIIYIPVFFRDAFGPISRNVEIDSQYGKLNCEETYNADMAAVIYDVSFDLMSLSADTISFGPFSFLYENWQDSLELDKIENWYVAHGKFWDISRIQLVQEMTKESFMYDFDPMELRNIKEWYEVNREIPRALGKSKILSINNDTIQVLYSYRLELNPPFEYKNARIDYFFNVENGELNIAKIYLSEKK